MGINGTCDCFNLPNATITSALITGNLTIEGVLACTASSSFDASCLGIQGPCLNFTNCTLNAKSLSLMDGSPTFLTVGRPGDDGTAQVVFGSSSNTTSIWRLLMFQTFALTSVIESSIYTQIQTLSGNMLIRVLGGLGNILTIASSGQISLQAQGNVNLQTLGSGNIVLQTSSTSGQAIIQAPGGIAASAATVNVSTTSFVLTAGGNNPYYVASPNSVQCSNPPLTVDTTVNSNTFFQDILMTNGAQILSTAGSGVLSIGPYVQICADQISGASGTLTVMGNLQATGSISSTGACCTSDPLVKRNITAVRKTKKLLDLANSLELIQFKWVKEYEDVDNRINKKIKYIGFNARQVRKVFPQATQIVTKSVGKVTYDDFHLLHKDEIIPIAIGAIQELTKRVLLLEKICLEKK
jgi:hypothetical protein